MSLVPCLKHRVAFATHQNGQICLRCAADHVGHEALVARSVQDGKVLFICLKVRPAHLHRLPFVPLLLVGV